jgi:methionine biosynthesis protein MetW
MTQLLRADLLRLASLIRPGEKVLDLGCGDGALLLHLKETRKVTARGVERSEPFVLACVRKGVSVRQGDLQEGLGDYPDQSFDTVVLSQTIPYLNDPEFIIKEMLRVGERAILSVPNWGHWRSRISFLFTGRFPRAADLDQPWYASPRARPTTVKDFEEYCRLHGIQIAGRIWMDGSRELPSWFDPNLFATTAIYELKRE